MTIKIRTLRIASKGLHFLEMYKREPEFIERIDRLDLLGFS
jgi:hypothetical protein